MLEVDLELKLDEEKEISAYEVVDVKLHFDNIHDYIDPWVVEDFTMYGEVL